jgi:hypothetical protein
MTARRTSTRKPVAAPSVLDGVVTETPAPTPKSVRPVRRPAAPKSSEVHAPKPAAKVPAIVKDVQADALISKAAPSMLGADGSLVRHTQDYTVDLLDPGMEPERDFAKVLAKDPSETHLDFVAWVAEYVGYEADAKTVQILISTYHEFQKTPAQKAKTIAKRVAAAEKRAIAARTSRAKAALAVEKAAK